MSIKTSIRALWEKIVGKPEPTIKFKCVEGAYHISTPVVEARRVIPEWMKPQIKNKDVKFARCPGMFDYAQVGYIIPAWCDIHIKVNKQGVMIRLDKVPKSLDSAKMDFKVVDGLAKVKDSGFKSVTKIPSPWSIQTKKGYSAYVVPAIFHSKFLDKLYVYHGVVDYDDFNVVNFPFTALEECEFTIWAGEPLLQIIPFKREDTTAEVGKASEEEKDLYNYRFYSTKPALYRKEFHKPKKYTITKV
jgi:hypothetical protein